MLEARNLTKFYGAVLALKEVSFTLGRGEVLGYLGPNGSGKTTTVEILVGLLEPTRGEVRFQGRNVKHDLEDYKSRLGYVPEVPNLYPSLSGLEYLELVGALRSIGKPLRKKKIDDLLALFSLHPDRHSLISSYSKGMRQRLLIAASLLHDPDILILDEPLSGLDVTSALIVENLIHTLASEGKIILYCSHVLESVERLCSHILILHNGCVVAHDSVERLQKLMALPSLERIFAQLVQQADTERIARDIVGVMKAR